MKKILLVDDDLGYSALLEWVLKDLGYYVEHAPDAKSAIKALENNSFDALIVDQWLPNGTNGLDLIKKIRNKGDRTGIIMLTCLKPMDIDDLTDGLEVWSIVDKISVLENDLVNKIENAIEFSGMTKETSEC